MFSAADGEHTVGDFIASMSAEYDGVPAQDLREQIHRIVRALAEEGIIEIHDQPRTLSPYFAEDYHAASPGVRAAQMRQDGLNN